MRNHYPEGHNVGLGMVEDSWEEKEIIRLTVQRDQLASRLRECVALLRGRDMTPTLEMVCKDAEDALRKARV
jgi:hypothetical protein